MKTLKEIGFVLLVAAALTLVSLLIWPTAANAVFGKTCDQREVARAIILKERPAMGPLEVGFWLDAIEAAASKHKLPLPVVVAKIAQESRFRGAAVSEAGAKGASQLMPMWVKGFDPFEIEANLDKGAEVLAYELNEVKGDVFRALRRYNGGGVSGEQSWNVKTEVYAAKVLTRVYVAQTQVCGAK